MFLRLRGTGRDEVWVGGSGWVSVLTVIQLRGGCETENTHTTFSTGLRGDLMRRITLSVNRSQCQERERERRRERERCLLWRDPTLRVTNPIELFPLIRSIKLLLLIVPSRTIHSVLF